MYNSKEHRRRIGKGEHRWCSSTYTTWTGMRFRCEKKNHISYKWYGGRGIKVCKRWLKFQNFLKDMGVKPRGLTLDRINNNGNYCKRNCRWVSREVQMLNTRVQSRVRL